jgi:hypothetical protein
VSCVGQAAPIVGLVGIRRFRHMPVVTLDHSPDPGLSQDRLHLRKCMRAAIWDSRRISEMGRSAVGTAYPNEGGLTKR